MPNAKVLQQRVSIKKKKNERIGNKHISQAKSDLVAKKNRKYFENLKKDTRMTRCDVFHEFYYFISLMSLCLQDTAL